MGYPIDGQRRLVVADTLAEVEDCYPGVVGISRSPYRSDPSADNPAAVKALDQRLRDS